MTTMATETPPKNVRPAVATGVQRSKRIAATRLDGQHRFRTHDGLLDSTMRFLTAPLN
jgi:hypothetical protein